MELKQRIVTGQQVNEKKKGRLGMERRQMIVVLTLKSRCRWQEKL